MAYAPDPGGVFDSDAHRRVLGHLTDDEAMELHALGHRISGDAHHGLQTVDELEDILKDLEADGYASSKGGWKRTKKGLNALQAPAPEITDPAPAILSGLETRGNSRG